MDIDTGYSKEDQAKILIVDDELLVAADIKRIIEKAGHTVIGSAVDAEEAISLVKSVKPDLVLMDIKLKEGIDGISAAEIIQTIDEIPIIFLTAFSDQKTFERAKKIGPFGYLIKPFNSRELTIAIETSLYKHSLEKRLKENEKKFRLFYEDSPLPYHSLDINGKILEINNAWLEQLGYLREEAVGHHISEFLSESSVGKWLFALDNLIFTNELKNADFEFIHKSGSRLFISVNGKISKNADGKFLQSHFVLHNITQQKLTENALRESENKMKSIFRAAPIGIGIMSNRIILHVNDEISRMTGYKSEELLGKDIKILCPNEKECIRVGKELMNQISTNGAGRVETNWIKKNGSSIDVILSKSPIDVIRPEKEMIFTALDITERRDAEKELKQSESRFRSYIEYSPLGIFTTNKFGRFTNANDAAAKMLGYSYSELVQMLFTDLLPDESINEGWSHFNKLKETGFIEIEIILRRKDNLKIWTMISAVKLAENRFIAYAQDISERKKTEDILKNSLKEKETLLRELYHRTKNNMQVISSILFLQTENSNNTKLNQILFEVSNRINAMSLVHHKLYQSKNLSKINLKEYIIDLLNLLMSIYSISKDKVIIKHDLSDVYVLIDYAIPCGLIINEIISNTFKYAFPGDCKGELYIKLLRNEVDEIVFIAKDNGVGIPENLDIQNPKTLGMKLIHNITQHQLNGIVSVLNKNGVCITISFKDNQYNTRI